MKKNYQTPSFQILEMNYQDVITASPTGTFDDSNGDTIVGWSE